jgi:uncharacterized protein (DUF697 family)
MHDLDRTLQEYESEYDPPESDTSEMESEGDFEEGHVFDELEEMELAAELLGAQDDQELEQFLGSLIKKASRKLRKVVSGPVGKALGGVLRKVARKALPMAGAALGNLVVPGLGGAFGSKLGTMAGKMFGLELEGLSPEDQEFEVARRIVRLGGEATRQATNRSSTGHPVQVAKDAVVNAAQRHAPGLTGGLATEGWPTSGDGHRRSGRWVRRGRQIVLLGF